MNLKHKNGLNQSINLLNFSLVIDENNYLTSLSDMEHLIFWGTDIGFEVPPFNFLPTSMDDHSDAILLMAFHST